MAGGNFDLEAVGRAHVLFRLFLGFALGVLMGWAFHAGYRPKPAMASALQALALLMAFGCIVLGFAELWVVFALALLVFATAGDDGFLAASLRIAPLQWLGKVSYGIYLLQWPLMLVMFNLDPKLAPYVGAAGLDLLRVVIFIVLLLGGAALSWRWLESPLMALARTPARRPGPATAG